MDLDNAFLLAGYQPKHLKIHQGRQLTNPLENMIGTHGNVILLTEAGKAPLTSMEVKTERGVYTLNLEHKEFSPISGNRNYNTAAMGTVKINHRRYKSVLCRFHESNKRCRNGGSCQYAHGKDEISKSNESGVLRRNRTTFLPLNMQQRV